MERQINIKHEQEELAASIHYPLKPANKEGRSKERVPLVIICHGFVGSRIGVDRLFVKTARDLAQEGYMVLRFDYAGCGESSGSYGSEGFESMINQTRSVLNYALSCTDVDPTSVTLIGHSLGGAVAIMTAVRDRRVKNLILWSSVGYPLNDIVKITGRDVYDSSIKSGTGDYLAMKLLRISLNLSLNFSPSKKQGNLVVMYSSFTEHPMIQYPSTMPFYIRRCSG